MAIHDSARPLVKADDVRKCLEDALQVQRLPCPHKLSHASFFIPAAHVAKGPLPDCLVNWYQSYGAHPVTGGLRRLGQQCWEWLSSPPSRRWMAREGSSRPWSGQASGKYKRPRCSSLTGTELFPALAHPPNSLLAQRARLWSAWWMQLPALCCVMQSDQGWVTMVH